MHPKIRTSALILTLTAALSACSTVITPIRALHRGEIKEELLNSFKGPGDGEGRIETLWLQINDVYEMLPTEGGLSGGLARVSKLEQKLIARNPNTRMVIAGDFFSPSAIGAAEYEGRKLHGRQMLDTLAEAGLDIATFGNHEFDIPEEDFRLRLKETRKRFTWVSANVLDAATNQPYEGTIPHQVIEFADQDGDRVRIGILSVTLPSSRKPYVKYKPQLEAARGAVEKLRAERADVIIGLTHQSIEEDRELARQVAGIDFIMGGHEHVAMRVRVTHPTTGHEVVITKADANAKTAWVHAFEWNSSEKKLEVNSTLQEIGDRTPEDTRITQLAQQWIKRAYDGYRAKGFEPDAPVTILKAPLDGRESRIRKESTALTETLLDALMNQAPDSDIALFNSGLVRVDDVIQPGRLREYDILRIAPFPDDVITGRMKGADLIKIRDYNKQAVGDGMYLQIRSKSPLNTLTAEREYTVVMNSYLAGRLRGGLAFSVDGKTAPAQDPILAPKMGMEFRKAIITSLRKR
jgi:5'-nucleotidase/UDP-sugar diphosphatase